MFSEESFRRVATSLFGISQDFLTLLDIPLPFQWGFKLFDNAKIRHFAKKTKCRKRFRISPAILFLIQIIK
jgi:hypothetical protein